MKPGQPAEDVEARHAFESLKDVDVEDVHLQSNIVATLSESWLKRCLITLLIYLKAKVQSGHSMWLKLFGDTVIPVVTLFTSLFAKHMMVAGIRATKDPTHRENAGQVIPADVWPHRISILSKGADDWTIGNVDDLTQLTEEAMQEPLEDTLWLITIFGRLLDPGLVPEQEREEPVKVTIRPNFDMKQMDTMLRNGNKEQRMRCILGIHERFWHASVEQMIVILTSMMVPAECLALVKETLTHCLECRKWTRPRTVPRLSAELAGFFKKTLVVDLLFLWKICIS